MSSAEEPEAAAAPEPLLSHSEWRAFALLACLICALVWSITFRGSMAIKWLVDATLPMKLATAALPLAISGAFGAVIIWTRSNRRPAIVLEGLAFVAPLFSWAIVGFHLGWHAKVLVPFALIHLIIAVAMLCRMIWSSGWRCLACAIVNLWCPGWIFCVGLLYFIVCF